MYLEIYLNTRAGERLRLDPCSGLVTNEKDQIRNGATVSYYQDGKLRERAIPPPSTLARRMPSAFRPARRS